MSERPSINIGSQRLGLEIIALIISAVSALITVGGLIWFGGRLAQRVDSHDMEITSLQMEVDTNREVNSRQDSDIAVTKSQYGDIITRLGRIENKVDDVRGK